MARLIVKSPYFKGGGAKPAGGYLRYIATRERVEILPDDRPPTKRQTQLIEKLTKDFPDTKTLLEYGDYAAHPTKFNASQFLTLAVEANWGKVQEIGGYAKYIATRPRAERMGEHGLFGDEAAVDLNAAMAEVNSYTGNIWTHIISLRRDFHAHKEINLKAMKLLPRGGYLATCSCSHFMKEELFVKMLQDAAHDANVSQRQIEARQQSPDHPILWQVPETNYLKFYIFQVV